MLAIAFNERLILWDLKKDTKEELRQLSNINDVRFNPSGTTLIIGLYEGGVYKIDLSSESNADSFVSENSN